MELTEVERLQKQVDGLKDKLRDFKLLKTRYALKVSEAREGWALADGCQRRWDKCVRALSSIADSDELVTAAKLRKYAAKVLGR